MHVVATRVQQRGMPRVASRRRGEEELRVDHACCTCVADQIDLLDAYTYQLDRPAFTSVHLSNLLPRPEAAGPMQTSMEHSLLRPLLASDFAPLLTPQAFPATQLGREASGLSSSVTTGVRGVQNHLPNCEERAEVGRLKTLIEEKAGIINQLRDENERLRRDLLGSRQEQTREIRGTTHSVWTHPDRAMQEAGGFVSPSGKVRKRRATIYQTRFELEEEAALVRFWFENRFDYSIKSRCLWRLAQKQVTVSSICPVPFLITQMNYLA